jgi:hypothetical protein
MVVEGYHEWKASVDKAAAKKAMTERLTGGLKDMFKK